MWLASVGSVLGRFVLGKVSKYSHVAGTSRLFTGQASDEPVEMKRNPYEKQRDSCVLCRLGVRVSYKNPKLLSQFVSPYTGLLYPRNITRLCYFQHERVQDEIKKARKVGMMSRFIKEPEYFKDPALFDPSKPIRPHRF
ncbi:unnamed protein product [Notodromas monacha]|uniref:Mitochondrial ribosomal protein S18C n=1 Tax=Notodromas monacha TaxID=399045 RepID=A0A7R9BNI1_9CRUS|nr:unnamed protein product [Notodromas monacha]CAG0917934.1 unnamed protein product [Notodromas monacha]